MGKFYERDDISPVPREVSQSFLGGQEQGVEYNPGTESGAGFIRKRGSSVDSKLARFGPKM